MGRRKKGNLLASLNDEKCELQMTPMIDVTFLLLIFFMCTLKFKKLEGKLSAYLPKDVGVNQSQAEPKEKIELRLDVKAQGNKINAKGNPYTKEDEDAGLRFVYDNTRVIEYSIGARKTTNLDDVAKSLKNFYQQDKERPATIDPRQGVITEDVVKVLDVALDVGFTDITFVGSYEK